MTNTAAEILGDVVAIPVTPFTDGAIDEAALRTLLERMIAGGITVFTPNGNTGEFYTLDATERRRVLEITAEQVGTRGTIVAGIGLDVSTAIAEGRIAVAAGARMAMVHQPVHPYVSEEGWLDYHARIADALPELGIVLYVRNTWVDGALIRRLADRCPNLVGVKYAVADPLSFARARAHAPELAWVAGLAEPYAVSYFAHGATGFTSGLVNVNPLLSIDLRDALRRGDFARARELTDRITRFEDLRAEDRSANNVSVVKEALAQLGLSPREVRPPSSPVSANSAREISGILRD